MIGFAIISALAAVYGAYSQYQAGEAAKDLAEENADAMQAEADEAARRLGSEQARSESLGRVRAMALGVGGDAVTANLENQVDENARQLAWLRTSGASAASIERDRGDLARREARASGVTTFASGMGSAGSYWASSTPTTTSPATTTSTHRTEPT